jgi:hypothetical protein
MSDITTVGDVDNWLCWVCDQPVDPDASVNAELGPSVDSYAETRVKKGAAAVERLAHRACNTMKGKISPVVRWSPELFVVDPSPIFEVVERLRTKGGREIVARCPDESDARQASEWLLDRVSRLAPDLSLSTHISPGGGQFMLYLTH